MTTQPASQTHQPAACPACLPDCPYSREAGEQASQSVKIGSRSGPSTSSQPPPASRGTVAVGADPGSEISITLGTDCTATTVAHTGSREILPFRTRAAVCPLLRHAPHRTALHTTAVQGLQGLCRHAKQHPPRPGPTGRPGHALTVAGAHQAGQRLACWQR